MLQQKFLMAASEWQFPQTQQRFPPAPSGLYCLPFRENEFVVNSEAVTSLQDVSTTHNGWPDYKTSFVAYLLQLLCCWSCPHSLLHRDARPETAEPVDKAVSWVLADCVPEQPQSRISVSKGTRW